jgi:hypothetical protein
MKNRLEEFVNRNRDSFDEDAPGAQLWKDIEKGTLKERAKIFNMFTLKQVAVSLLVIANAVTIFLLLERRPVMQNKPGAAPTEQVTNQEPAYEKELDQISRIVEIKQAKLKEIGKSNPVLYKTFMGALEQLNSSYRELEKELDTNPNKEQLLEAMIQNLSLQQELLNQQLYIYQKIKQTQNEKNSKSI